MKLQLNVKLNTLIGDYEIHGQIHPNRGRGEGGRGKGEGGGGEGKMPYDLFSLSAYLIMTHPNPCSQ